MENMETWQTILLVITLIYGIAFGFENVIFKIKLLFNPKKQLVQADWAKLTDAAFIVSVVYFCITFVKF